MRTIRRRRLQAESLVTPGRCPAPLQYVSTGLHPAGLATLWIDPVWFHFGINLVFLAAMAVAFLGLRIPRDLLRPAALA